MPDDAQVKAELDEIERVWRSSVDQIVNEYSTALSTSDEALADAQEQLAEQEKVIQGLKDALLRPPFEMDKTEATLDNTGLPAYWKPKQTLRGDQTFTDGQVIEDADIFGRVFWTGKPILRRCKIRGLPRAQIGPSNTALMVGWKGEAGRIEVYDSDLIPDESWFLWDGFSGHHGYFERVKFRYLTDNVSAIPASSSGIPDIDVEVAGCWGGDHSFWTQAGTGVQVHPSDTKTHNDGTQLHGGKGLKIHGTTWNAAFAPKGIGRGTDDYPDNRANACVQWNDAKGKAGASDIGFNHFYGGQVHLNMGAISEAGRDLGSVHDNVMDPASSRLNRAALIKMQAPPSTTTIPKVVWERNVDHNGNPVSPSRG